MATPTTPTTTTIFSDKPHLRQKYWERLKLHDQYEVEGGETNTIKPTKQLLCKLTEAHLRNIPFENLSQHINVQRPSSSSLLSSASSSSNDNDGSLQLLLPTLDFDQIATKVLERQRGGFCFELNGLFSEFLIDLGYKDVILVPAIVCRPTPILFNHKPTHVIIIVTLDDGNRYYVDVAFGEPPIHPLLCTNDVLENNDVQTTPDGMISRLSRRQSKETIGGDDDNIEDKDNVILEWYKENDDGVKSWIPRLQWKHHDMTIPDNNNNKRRIALADFQPALDLVLQDGSNFSRKIIVCQLTRDTKTTLAGNILKITGPPRFSSVCPPNPSSSKSSEDIQDYNDDDKDDSSLITPAPPPITIESLESIEKVKQVLLTKFGIPLQETKHLDINKSKSQDPTLWSQM